MGNEVYESQKCTLKYSKSKIDKAAKAIREGCSQEEKDEAIAMIQNFRELHLYPLMLMKNHLARTAAKVDKEKKILVARRLKRLYTIIDKLERPSLDGGKTSNSIQLTRMQDIGGCRAIVKNIEQLKHLKDRLVKSRSVHKIIKEYDYLTPKDSGYGGIHLAYSCFDHSDEKFPWRKTKIEIQLRTELQHAWATSLEIIDTLEDIKLKTSSEGHEEWRRFFYLAGCLVAHDEKACLLKEEVVTAYQRELKDLEKSLNVKQKLNTYTFALSLTSNENIKKQLPKNHKGYFLVSMRHVKTEAGEPIPKRFLVSVNAYRTSEAEDALATLNNDDSDPEVTISVLVATDNIKSLKKAYPNYFGSTNQFSRFLNRHIK
ncbi:TPA: RelA/SpoT domain-containing protein [Serratia marcescens]|uniref:RelA/SpoT domain-containing protein n=1 Tax=Serratia marcescens TaxID=615 RepID=UPI00059732E0|nr:RelA/SpoT domain-containing protein [Serratia marcescens]BCZ41474.1 (p)ppGpp synthetase [Serratia marcescens]HBI6269430.1 RelA/SpoT domain-containing protein [Serratia marcescens]HBI6949645.1 RelA/SpoT domain-containing protein [Serratia marcescens]HBI6959895.1 RelA/SpoT domain-containing protein [Serratia marcescens]